MSGEYNQVGGAAEGTHFTGEAAHPSPAVQSAETALLNRLLRGLKNMPDEKPAQTPTTQDAADVIRNSGLPTEALTVVSELAPPTPELTKEPEQSTLPLPASGQTFSWFSTPAKPDVNHPFTTTPDAAKQLLNRIVAPAPMPTPAPTTKAQRHEQRLQHLYQAVQRPSRGLAIEASQKPERLALPALPTPELAYDPLTSPWHMVSEKTTPPVTDYDIMQAERLAHRMHRGFVSSHSFPEVSGEALKPKYDALTGAYSEVVRFTKDPVLPFYDSLSVKYNQHQVGRHARPAAAIASANTVQPPADTAAKIITANIEQAPAAQQEQGTEQPGQPEQPGQLVIRPQNAPVAPIHTAGSGEITQSPGEAIHVITDFDEPGSEYSEGTELFMTRVEAPAPAVAQLEATDEPTPPADPTPPELEVFHNGQLIPFSHVRHDTSPQASTALALPPLPNGSIVLHRRPAVRRIGSAPSDSSSLLGSQSALGTPEQAKTSQPELVFQLTSHTDRPADSYQETTVLNLGPENLRVVPPPLIPHIRPENWRQPTASTAANNGGAYYSVPVHAQPTGAVSVVRKLGDTQPTPASHNTTEALTQAPAIPALRRAGAIARVAVPAQVEKLQDTQAQPEQAEQPKDGRRKALLGRLAMGFGSLLRRKQAEQQPVATQELNIDEQNTTAAQAAPTAAHSDAAVETVEVEQPTFASPSTPAPQSEQYPASALEPEQHQQSIEEPRLKKLGRSVLVGAGLVAAGYLAARRGRGHR